VVFFGMVLAGCGDQGTSYTLDTPEDTLDSAKRMVETGEAQRLVELIYAETPEQRSLLGQAGRLLGALQDLGEDVQAEFPEELAAFKAEAEEAAAENRATSWVRHLTGTTRMSGPSNFGASQIRDESLRLETGSSATAAGTSGIAMPAVDESTRQIFNALAKQLLADPYAFLSEGRDKLSTVYVSDDSVAILWDERPIAPPIGLGMRETERGWQVVIPWHLPGLRRFKPRNENEFKVFGSMMRTFENVARDLENDLEAGEINDMTDLADTAVEKAAIPAVMVFYAYTELIEQRGKSQETAAADDAPSAEPDAP
jgi:hypothetical protein